MFPTSDNPYYGIFVSEQVKAVERWHPDVNYEVYFINGRKGLLSYLRSLWKVNMLINSERYDIVHIHYGLSGLYLYWPFRKYVPTLITMHGSDIMPNSGIPSLVRKVTRHVVRSSDAAIVLNDEMDSIVSHLVHRTYRIACSVDTEVFRPFRRNAHQDYKQIVFPSNKERWVKNYTLFAETLELLKSKYGIICREHEIKGMTRQEIATLLATSDLLLMTSHSEGSPQVVKEAMACNLPVVSVPVGDVSYLLDGVKDCYVAKRPDATELAALVVQSLHGDGSGICGRERIFSEGLDDRSVANKIYKVYTSLVDISSK